MGKELNPVAQKALKYIQNTGGRIPVETFDDDNEPIGPQLREDIRDFVIEENGELRLNDFGKSLVGAL